jgi:PadR family transcriptional regulator, regulatory protein PadR
VKSALGDPTPERGGRSKRYFHVTAKGVAAVNRAHRALHSMSEGLNLIERYA